MQIRVYSENGGVPKSWNQRQKGVAKFNFYDTDIMIKFQNFTINIEQFVSLCLAEYILVSLSISLVIAKFFPAVHSQIVSKATNLEYQSLYWGTAVVSNVFVYGLLFASTRAFIISQQHFTNPLFYNIDYNSNKEIESAMTTKNIVLSLLVIEEIIIHAVLFVGAVIASRSHHDGVPIPAGMAKAMINIFTCFCCCICCSQYRREKILRVMLLFSFMAFIYHSVMDTIAIGFILFDEDTRTAIFSVTMLYVSMVFFLVVVTSFSLFLLIRVRRAALYQQALYCCGRSFVMMTVFSALMLLAVMYIIVFFTLKLSGFGGVVTGLLPSVALSAITWFIKKKLDSEHAVSESLPAMSKPKSSASDGSMNDELTENLL